MSTEEAQSIWKEVLGELQSAFSAGVFKLHFQNSKVVRIEENGWVVSVASQFSADELNKKFGGSVQSFVEERVGQEVRLLFEEKQRLNKKKEALDEAAVKLPLEMAHDDVYADTTLPNDFGSSAATRQQKEQFINSPTPRPTTNFTGLNPTLVFESFIVGSSNNVAYAAAQAVAENPGRGYNPLFIYGGVGLGKTHLMQAVGNAIIQKFPHYKVQYFPSERFINDFIGSLKEKTIESFRTRYRAPDVILIDDIQFMSGKDSTQEEFFHTFNEIVGRGGHILMTCDRMPEEIVQLEDRLRSRFKGGMMVDIGLPDYEMRVAIIRSKCIDLGYMLEESAVEFLASRIQTNTRELQGKLFQIVSKLKTNGFGKNLEDLKRVWGEEETQTDSLQGRATPQKVLQVVHNYFNIRKIDLTGNRRLKTFVVPRQICMYLLKNELSVPLEKIGQLLGGRDHTTVLHGVKQVELALSTSSEMRKEVMLIKQQILGQV
jgi:chromosomal replication initiator protein